MKRDFKKRKTITLVARQYSSEWKGRLILLLCILGMLIVLSGLAIIGGVNEQRRSLDNQLSRWKSLYHINDEQASRIRELELKFHGNGNPFTSRDSGTPEEDEAHHQQISRVMSPDDGRRFLDDVHKKHRSP